MFQSVLGKKQPSCLSEEWLPALGYLVQKLVIQEKTDVPKCPIHQEQDGSGHGHEHIEPYPCVCLGKRVGKAVKKNSLNG